ncbi:ig-like domain-containing protein [Nephila pilipes]|uniref:Ig-like domain-containing protein n=1 Tax=Nephila pilipes TaxID=299642 RepID=A0A8X6NR87_NEPPI|nr:ig-like domain-containing protein [Nephila pilipes]
MLELQVPPSIMRGQPITLNCTFDLEEDTLYSIKWYKNNVEFYRYILGDRPPGQKYPLQGIYLDNKFPHGPSIHMYKTDLASEGTYRCEVSSEAPVFDTVRDEKELRVYAIKLFDIQIWSAHELGGQRANIERFHRGSSTSK